MLCLVVLIISLLIGGVYFPLTYNTKTTQSKLEVGKQRVTYDMLRLTICYLNSYRYSDSAIIDT